MKRPDRNPTYSGRSGAAALRTRPATAPPPLATARATGGGAGSGLRDYQMLTGEGLPEYDEEPNTIPSTMPMITGY